ncbi:hypothetical protein NYA22BAC_00667 [Parasphingorhabdus sp. NYA22]
MSRVGGILDVSSRRKIRRWADRYVADFGNVDSLNGMKHSSIISFLRGEMSAGKFLQEVQVEVDRCIDDLKTKGFGNIIVNDGPLTIINRNHAARLFKSVLANELPIEVANYLADGLIMSEDFDFAEDETVEALHFLADDSRPPTIEEIEAIFAELQ